MAIEKTIVINADTKKAVKDVQGLDKVFKDVDKAVESAEKTTQSLTGELRKLKQQLASGTLSPEEFKQASIRAGELTDAIGDVSARVKILSSDTQNLDALMSAGSGLAGGFSVVQGAMGAFGAESEDVSKAILKVQSSLAILNGVQAVANALNKDSALMVTLQTRGITALTIAKKLYAVVVGTATGAMKLFRIALVSTGVGALVVGLGLLIANFETITSWVGKMIDKFGGWRKVLMFVAPPIWAIVRALEAMGIIDDKQTADAKKNAEIRIEASKKESRQLDKRKKGLEDYWDFEIRKAKASGENTEKIEARKRKALLGTLEAQNKLEESWIKTGKASADDKKRWDERQKEIKAIIQDITIAELEAEKSAKDRAEARSKREKEEAERRREAQRKALEKEKEDRIKAEQEERNRIAIDKADLLSKIEALENEYENKQLTQQQREINAIEDKYFQILELARQNGEDTTILEQARLSEINEITEKAEKEKNDKILALQTELENQLLEAQAVTDEEKDLLEIHKLEKERAKREQELIDLGIHEEERARLLESFNMKIAEKEEGIHKSKEQTKQQMALDSLSIISDLVTAFAGENEQAQKRAFKLNKAIAMSQALMSTRQAVAGALAEPSVVPGERFAKAVMAGGVGLAQVVKIAKTQFNSGATPPSTVDIPSPSDTRSQPANFNVVGNSGVNQLADSLNAQPIKAYVVSGDVTSAQSLERNKMEQLTF